MKRPTLFKLFTVLVVVLGAIVSINYYLGPNNIKGQNNVNTTGVANADVGYPELSLDDRSKLDAKIENWQLYQEDTSIQLGTQNCSKTEHGQRLGTFNSGIKKSLALTSGYSLVITPNHYNWNQQQLEVFGSDPGVICGAASYAPITVVSGYVLWGRPCSTGFEVDVSSPGYSTFVVCKQGEDIVRAHFGVVD